MMLIDKSYYDYDYEPKEQAPKDIAETALNDQQTRELVSRFGFGVQVSQTGGNDTANELQQRVMRECESETK